MDYFYVRVMFKIKVEFILIAIIVITLAFRINSGFAGEYGEKDSCGECHDDPQFVDQNGRSLYVNYKKFVNSVHGDISCSGCHADAVLLPHEEKLEDVDCSLCHARSSEKYENSIHGRAHVSGDESAPWCSDCHGDHYILKVKNPKSRVSRINLVKVCLNCHMDKELEAEHDLPDVKVIKAYTQSVHGVGLLKAGLSVSAQCEDCHGSHDIKPPDDPGSLRHKVNIPAVCARCHSQIFQEYKGSIHGEALYKGNPDVPVCTDCHGEHTILVPTSPESKVSAFNIPTTCGKCHQEAAIAEKYGIAAKRYVTYLNSYHGVANKYGKTVVANCASCHGIHDIRPSADPASSVNPASLVNTCGKCHPGAGVNILKGKIHIEATKESARGVYYVRKFYTWFIGILVALFVSYITIETIGYLRRRRGRKAT